MGGKGFWARRPHAVPAIVAAVLLFAALARWPYDYYRVLRWVTCAAAAFVAWQGYALNAWWAVGLFAFIALLFNPFLPVHLTRETWQIIDLAAAAAFVAALAALSKPIRKGQTGKGEERETQADEP